tara:strand:- start:115 stop:369 length:255 start_codon:yes stop_codon:yes gene_type:complete
MSDKPKAKTEKKVDKKVEKKVDKKVDNDAINFRNATVRKINSLQAALNKEKKRNKNSSTSNNTPRIQGMGQLGAHSKASKTRTA